MAPEGFFEADLASIEEAPHRAAPASVLCLHVEPDHTGPPRSANVFNTHSYYCTLHRAEAV
jgi:hypothetical protein